MQRMKKVKQYSMYFLSICCVIAISTIIVCKCSPTVYAGTGLTRGEWVHNLVDMFNMTIEGELVPDDYYEDIVTSEYYEDILTAIYFDVVDLEAGEDFHPNDAVTREFARCINLGG